VYDYTIRVEVWSKSIVGSDKIIGITTFSTRDIQESKCAKYVGC
jgi:hypothetical protein